MHQGCTVTDDADKVPESCLCTEYVYLFMLFISHVLTLAAVSVSLPPPLTPRWLTLALQDFLNDAADCALCIEDYTSSDTADAAKNACTLPSSCSRCGTC